MVFKVSKKIRAIQMNHTNAVDKVSTDAGSVLSVSERSIKLPTIKLPSLNGDVTQFRHFHNTFVSLVVNNEELEDIAMYYHFLSSLTGEERNVIAHLPVTRTNFKVAFDLVCNRYNNPRLVASAHLNKLLTLPAITKSCSGELLALLNEALSNVYALMALQLDVSLRGLITSQLLTERVEHSITTDSEDRLSSSSLPTFKETCAFLENKCKSLEIAKTTAPQRQGTTVNKQQNAPNTKQFGHSKQTYVATSTACVMCYQPHVLHKCSKFKQAMCSERKAVVMRNNLCHNCLKNDHRAS
ncbi:uncharacterized protein LOC124556210 [Schistocerca americana]|uniref:uncharacterized protein LOC124556210 n=1 Tax=Schistocerca americana TaxID=7009 RepID=UPI001F4FD74D|nr:uncharacterized protein LOC124556210 [Schistocerca americana]